MHLELPKGLTLDPSPTGISDAETTKAEEVILTLPALEFLEKLHRKFEKSRQKCLQTRQEVQQSLDQGIPLNFLKDTSHIREDKSWKVGATPPALQKRWVEITGPTDAKMMINALNSGADVFMADFEDANAPTWHNLITGQYNLTKAIAGTLAYKSPEGKEYALKDKTAVLMVRPRGWHLVEKHVVIDDIPISASLFDFGLAFFHNAKKLLAKGAGPYFYLPKIEDHHEARLWNDIFIFAQEALGIPRGTIRATVLIETIPAAFQMEEILYELREHSAGLNAGRWDYLFSILKKLARQKLPLMPDRGLITMSQPFMRAYNVLLVYACHSRDATAIGGMAAYIPSRKDPAVNEIALNKVREDKLRESALGFDGTWIAHPDLVPLAHEVFAKALNGKPNQKDKGLDVPITTAQQLLDFRIASGTVTEAGLRQNISVVLQYLFSWLQGVGAVAINNLMEDAATAEISCAQLWHWLHYPNATFSDGKKITPQLYASIADEEVNNILKRAGANSASESTLKTARQILDGIVKSNERTDFLTLSAYRFLK